MNRTRAILEDLEAVRENLLALSDDIWLSIDHNDPDEFEAGVEFKRSYNAKAAAFDVVASELSTLVQQYTSVRLEETEQSGGSDQGQNQRIVAELNHEEPHSLDEDFTFKRPYGFILQGQATTGVTTWQRLYQLVCLALSQKDEDLFRSLCHHPTFVTNRGNPLFSYTPDELRKSLPITGGVFAECNYSANGVRDVLRRLLPAFNIPTTELVVFLRQDRDAGKLADDH